ncbi:hypothetical protein LR48_Vigan813s000100 [Vigna angularis]|nr:hypothetical protein LR48_Vigan813s000100 [Vigna angularis]
MAIDLTPKKAEALFELQPRGFALPHYADSSKVGYVIQGSDGVVGMVLPDGKEEVVVKLKEGDVIAVPVGAVSWWFNDGDTDLIIVFLGETSKALIPGKFTYFFLTGAIGVIGGFSTDLTSKIYGLEKDEVEKLTRSQTGVLIIKLDKTQPMPEPQLNNTKKLVYNIDGAEPENAVEKAGLVKTLTEKDFGFIEDVGLSLIRVKLEPNAIKAPSYPRVLSTRVEAGDLVVVPQFFVVAEIAGEEGLESYSIVTTTKPLFQDLAGKASIWSIFSSTLQQVALNVDSDFQKLFISKIEESTNLIPPST